MYFACHQKNLKQRPNLFFLILFLFIYVQFLLNRTQHPPSKEETCIICVFLCVLVYTEDNTDQNEGRYPILGT